MCRLQRKVLSESLMGYRDRRIPGHTLACYRPLDYPHRRLVTKYNNRYPKYERVKESRGAG